MKVGWVYIMANDRPTLYAGVTNNLVKRSYEHKIGKGSKFTSKYKLKKLVYYEKHDSMLNAIFREKQIKNMNRKEKLNMIRNFNPDLHDLYKDIL